MNLIFSHPLIEKNNSQTSIAYLWILSLFQSGVSHYNKYGYFFDGTFSDDGKSENTINFPMELMPIVTLMLEDSDWNIQSISIQNEVLNIRCYESDEIS